MANLQSEVSIIFRGIDETGKAIDSVVSNTNQIATNLQAAVDPVSDLTKKIILFEGAILAAGVAVTAYATKVAGDFDTGFREIATLIDVPLEALGDFRQSLIDYAADSTASFDQINSAIYSAISAGVDYTKSLDFVRDAEQLSIAGRADLRDSTVLLASVLNAYGLEAKDAAWASDLLFTAVKQGQTTIPELGGSLGRVLPSAAALGVELGVLTAALATLTVQGQETPVATTNLNAALNSLLAPSESAKKAAQELGIEIGAAAVQSKGFDGVLNDIYEATGGNIEAMAGLVGGTNALNAVLGLTGKNAKLFSDNIEASANAANSARDAAEKMAPALQTLEGPLSAFFITLGTPFLEPLRNGVGALSEIINAFTKSLGDKSGLGGIQDIVVGIADDLVSQLESIAKNLPAALAAADFSQFKDGLTVLTDAVKNLFSGLDLTSVEGLTQAIQLAGTAFFSLSNFTASAIEQFTPFFTAIIEIVPTFIAFVDAISGTAGAIGGLAVVLSVTLAGVVALTNAIIAIKGSAALAGLIAILTGPAGLVIAAGATGVAIGTFIDSLIGDKIGEFIDKVTGLDNAFTDSTSQVALLADEHETFRVGLRDTADQIDQLTDVMGDQSDVIDEVIVDIDALAKSYSGLADEVAGEINFGEGLNADQFDEFLKKVQELSVDALNPFGEALENVERISRNFGISMNDAFKALEDAGGNAEKAAEALEEAGFKIRDMTVAADNAPKSVGELKDSLSEMAASGDVAKDKIAQLQVELAKAELEAAVKLDIARLQEDTKRLEIEAKTWTELAKINAEVEIVGLQETTKRVEAAFGSINNIFDTTSSTIGALISAMLGVDDVDKNARQKLEAFSDALDRQIAIQEQAADNQSKLIDAQVEELKARSQALRSGQSLITIDGGGLQPELEAFMFRILQAVQMRANSQASALLLGI